VFGHFNEEIFRATRISPRWFENSYRALRQIAVIGHGADASLPYFRGSVASRHMKDAFKFNIGFNDLATR
jgi:hypothetical protein